MSVDPASYPDDIEPSDLDPDVFLAQLNQWHDLGGDETGPPPEWSEALELMDEAFRLLASRQPMEQAFIGFADAYASVVGHHLRGGNG